MSTHRELAATPGGEDPSREPSTLPSRRRPARRRPLAAISLIALVACSRLAPSEAPSERPGPAAAVDEGGQGTRARGDEGALPSTTTATPPPDQAARTVVEQEALEEKAKVANAPIAPAASAANAPAPLADKKADVASAHGIGLAGIGEGGGGRALGAGRAAQAPVASTAASAGGSVQHRGGSVALGRLGGRHLSLAPRPAPTMALAPTPAPSQEFDTEAYRHVADNPFQLVKDAPLSTFSVDVDTASYSNMRRFVSEGRRPPEDAIRVEEWINYFGYDDAPPSGGEPVAIATELSTCPWDDHHELLRVSLTTQPIRQEQVPPRNLVFLVDVSGSMMPPDKLPLLKRGLGLLARQLRPQDTLAIVVYAGASGVALPPTSGADQATILAALDRLESGGSTNGAEGIQLAYRVAESRSRQGGINRVILATDGDFNVGVTSEGELQRLIEEKRKTGVFLTVLGFGRGNLKDTTMEMLADKGNGNYAYVDSLAEARKVLVHEAGATLVTVAQDVKLQLEMNPRLVQSYRLVGYENRVLAAQDFNDDRKDAGEMGAGHHVTAFYEIVPTGAAPSGEAPAVDALKYQTERAPGTAAASNELLTVKIRYKPPGGSQSLLMTRAVPHQPVAPGATSDSFRFGAAVAGYAMTFRHSRGFGEGALPKVRALAAGAIGADPRGERREFLALMDRLSRLPTN